MLISSVLLCSFLGLLLNMGFSTSAIQPDWSFAILLGALLSAKRDWPWIFPSICLHDLLLFWSVGTTFPYFLLITILLMETDRRLGPGQPQRWLALMIAGISLLVADVSMMSWWMTMMLSVGMWFWLSLQQDRDYVESA